MITTTKHTTLTFWLSVLSLFLLGGLLAACGGTEENVNETAPATVAVATETEMENPNVVEATAVTVETTAIDTSGETAVANPTVTAVPPDSLPCNPPIIVGQPLQIVFQSSGDNEDSNFNDIYSMNSDGTGLTRLIRTSDKEYWPHWTPDGSQIAYYGQDGLYTMNPDGSGAQAVDIPSSVPVSWSPDGQEIAYFASPPSESEGLSFVPDAPQIFISNRDGSNARQLTDMELAAVNPIWSPDGSQILFQYGPYSAINYGDERNDLPINLYIINSDGSGLRQLAPGEHDQIKAMWSPDGSQIAFLEQPVRRIAIRDGENINYDDIFIVNADGTKLQQITNDNGRVGYPVWSPDGNQLAYLQYTPGNWGRDNTALQIINKDGTCPQRLLDFDDLAIWSLAWSPYDSRLLLGAMVMDEEGRQNGTPGIYILYADGTELTRLTPEEGVSYSSPAWQRTGADPLAMLDTAVTQSAQTNNNTNVTAALPQNTAIPFTVGDLARTQSDGIYTQVNYFGMFDMLLGDLGCNEMSFDLNEGEGRFEEAYKPLDWSTTTLSYLPKTFPDLYDQLTLFSCDWQTGDTISLQLTTPAGETLEKTQ